MVFAYFINEEEVVLDQRKPCKTDQVVSLDQLKEIGVEYFKFNGDNYENDESYNKMKKERGYSYQDSITVNRERLPNYEEKIKSFFVEHLHKDEEIRFIVDGSGYFDVRDTNNKWIRIAMVKGDLIVLPAGIYHRFTVDESDYIVAVRLFQGEPVWTPYNRPADHFEERKQYVTRFVNRNA